MPVFARDFHVSAAESSLSLSLTTGLLAPAMIVAGVLSEARGRKADHGGVAVCVVAADARVGVRAAVGRSFSRRARSRASRSPDFRRARWLTSAKRCIRHPSASRWDSPSAAMDSAACAGDSRRGLLSDFVSWRVRARRASACVGLVATRDLLAHAAAVAPLHAAAAARSSRWLRRFAMRSAIRGSRRSTRTGSSSWARSSRRTTTSTYHLLAPPYSLRQSVVGSIFIVYLLGILASAWIGRRREPRRARAHGDRRCSRSCSPGSCSH